MQISEALRIVHDEIYKTVVAYNKETRVYEASVLELSLQTIEDALSTIDPLAEFGSDITEAPLNEDDFNAIFKKAIDFDPERIKKLLLDNADILGLVNKPDVVNPPKPELTDVSTLIKKRTPFSILTDELGILKSSLKDNTESALQRFSDNVGTTPDVYISINGTKADIDIDIKLQ